MIEIKEVENLMQDNMEFVELRTRINIVEEYVKKDPYPTIDMIMLMLGIDYKKADAK